MILNTTRPFAGLPLRQRGRTNDVRATASTARSPAHSAAGAAVASALALMLNAPPDAAAETLLQGPARVVDGDTLYIGTEKVRLFGLDAPESKQQCTDSGGRPYACGQVSAQALEARIQSRPVTCAVKNKDQYGRNVAACSLGSEDIGAWMVKNGHAVAYKQYSKEYVPLEAAAQTARLGIWQGNFETPSDWRKEQKGIPIASPSSQVAQSNYSAGSMAPTLVAAPPLKLPSAPCLNPSIKGNISSRGEKIYHVPGGAFYDRVKIDLDGGERMFCSEGDAAAAGWRPASK